MSAKFLISGHRFAKLGELALAELQKPSAAAPTEAFTAASEVLALVEPLFSLSPDPNQVPSYPYPLRNLTWRNVEAAALTVIRSGDAWNGFRWLCISVCQGNSKTCYLDLAAMLSACADFALGAAAWKDRELDEVGDIIAVMSDGARRSLRGLYAELLRAGGDRGPIDTQAVSSCLQAAERLQSTLAKKEQNSSALEALIDLIERQRDGSKQSSPDAPKVQAADGPAPTPAVASAAVPAARAASGETRPAVDRQPPTPASPAVSPAARPAAASPESWPPPSQQQGGVTNPLPYWGRRVQVWEAASSSTATTPGPTPEKAEQILAELTSDAIAAATALDKAESYLLSYPLWLELQPLVISWLGQLGAVAARDAVRMATAVLLANRPDLPSAVLSSGVRAMSENAAKVLGEDAERVRDLPAPARPPQVAELRKELDVAQQKIRNLEAGRERFLCRLEMAELCRSAGRLDLVVAGLTGLLSEAEHYHLSDWEPKLMKRLLRAYLAVGAEREAGVSIDVRRRLLSQFYRLEPLEAERF